MELYSIKMRSSNKNQHISGAERITQRYKLEEITACLLQRALEHSNGEPDFVQIKIERFNQKEIQYLQALPVSTIETKHAEEGLQAARMILRKLHIPKPEKVLKKLAQTYKLRGAMLLDINSMERLELDLNRGIRATCMDYVKEETIEKTKNHFREALALATKVVHHPDIAAEICISDDPDYVTGYVASKELGYIRITNLKEKGSKLGGRIFLYKGEQKNIVQCIHYIEKQKVLIKEEVLE